MSESIAVFGASGRTGVETVKQLLNSSNNYTVKALVRNEEKAYEVLSVIPRNQRAQLEIKSVDLKSKEEIKAAITGCKSVIFTACGVSFLGLFNRAGGPAYVDYGGVKNLVDAVKELKVEEQPKIVLISSLGVTRPYWPIYIMLNTLGGRVMTYKLRGEDYLRTSELNYCIIRPGRLVPEEKQPQLKEAPLAVDQGDKITGQILREDVAMVAIHCAVDSEAPNKCTFELISGQSQTEPEHTKNLESLEYQGRDCRALLANIKSDLQVSAK